MFYISCDARVRIFRRSVASRAGRETFDTKLGVAAGILNFSTDGRSPDIELPCSYDAGVALGFQPWIRRLMACVPFNNACVLWGITPWTLPGTRKGVRGSAGASTWS